MFERRQPLHADEGLVTVQGQGRDSHDCGQWMREERMRGGVGAAVMGGGMMAPACMYFVLRVPIYLPRHLSQ